MTKEMYKYQISGYYFAGKERKHFSEVIVAADNIEAMQIVIGKYAWHESLANNTFKLDVIHYDCWD